ncbi:MAG TPA: hypothetical protein VMB51_13165 [Solirubrobacteraceae bacterium]|nr:hypothetical protein [Solirubrobacteraceae bacterium]
MGRRGRRRGAQADRGAHADPEAGRGGGRDKLKAPTGDYTDEQGNVLTLRGSLTPATRAQYASTLAGNPLSREDAWQRAVEFLFERLAIRWTIAGAPLEGQHELLARYRAGTAAERSWIRDSIRAHCAENFPDVNAP